MVRDQLEARGVGEPRVLEAMGEVPRERFVPERVAHLAYDDGPLPLEEGQTISQPYIVAAMVDAAAIGPDARALEVGTGSGYGAAILSRVAGEVVSVERHAALAATAGQRLAALGYDNVTVLTGDGSLGTDGDRRFDAIIVTAAGPEIPAPLLDLLVDGGRLLMPVERTAGVQRLVRATRIGEAIEEEDLGAVRFVPLIGEHAWSAPRLAPHSAAGSDSDV